MCGRARLATDYSELRIQLRLGDFASAPNWRPSWNIAPTQDMLAVVRDAEVGRMARPMRWGLIPGWSKDEKPKYATFNAKGETVATAPAFRGAWKAGRRCLVVVDGFYEWRKTDKQPFAIGKAGGKLVVMAGLWETWRSEAGEMIASCTVITTDANAVVAPIHNRMPVILVEPEWPIWLGESLAGLGELKALFRPYPGDDLVIWPVGKRVGNVRNNDPALAVPVATT